MGGEERGGGEAEVKRGRVEKIMEGRRLERSIERRRRRERNIGEG